MENAENPRPHRSQTYPESGNPQSVIVVDHGAPMNSFQRHPEPATSISLNSVVDGIQSLAVQNAMVVANMFQRNEPQSSHNHQSNPESIVINLEDIGVNTNNENIERERENNSNNNNDENLPIQTVISARYTLQAILKYVPFILILFIKCLFDYYEIIFILVMLCVAFVHSDSTVKKEAIKGHKRSKKTLFLELLYIWTCFNFSQDSHKFFNFTIFREFQGPLTIGTLLWILIITDFMLKLCTVTIKILFTLLPAKIFSFKKRGKIYLFIEASSQLYRSFATINPWLNYLLESYQGFGKILSVFLSAFYMISKSTDVLGKLKLIFAAISKLIQNVSLGTSPTKNQIEIAGGMCPICHDEYDSPVLLSCRHIFCENCITTWFDRDRTCPLCRATIVDDPAWRDGSTSHFIQLY